MGKFSSEITSIAILLFIFATPSNGQSIIPPPPGDQCVSPIGEGLGPAIRELVDLLPSVDLITIYLTAVSSDPEVQESMAFLNSPEFLKIVDTMNNRKEYIDVLEYLCEELHFDAYYYVNTLAELIGLPTVTRPPPIVNENYYTVKQQYRHRRSLAKSRKGLNGLLLDLKDALPMDKLRETYKRRYEQDKYLRLAMEKIGSDEFRRIGDAIEALPEYQDMLNKLRSIGVDVDKIMKAIMDFFNWNPKN